MNQEIIKSFRELGIDVLDKDGEPRKMSDLINALAYAWNGLSDEEKHGLSKSIAN